MRNLRAADSGSTLSAKNYGRAQSRAGKIWRCLLR
jgi:hypothetical protein